MASFTTDVPDILVAPLVAALAAHMGVPVPATDAGKIALAQAFTKAQLKDVLINYRSQQAAQAARANLADPAINW